MSFIKRFCIILFGLVVVFGCVFSFADSGEPLRSDPTPDNIPFQCAGFPQGLNYPQDWTVPFNPFCGIFLSSGADAYVFASISNVITSSVSVTYSIRISNFAQASKSFSIYIPYFVQPGTPEYSFAYSGSCDASVWSIYDDSFIESGKRCIRFFENETTSSYSNSIHALVFDVVLSPASSSSEPSLTEFSASFYYNTFYLDSASGSGFDLFSSFKFSDFSQIPTRILNFFNSGNIQNAFVYIVGFISTNNLLYSVLWLVVGLNILDLILNFVEHL